MKIRTAIACLIVGIVTALLIVTTPLLAQEFDQNFFPTSVLSEEDNQILARVTSREGIPTSPELKSQLNQFVELDNFGSIAFRGPSKFSSRKATPIVLFHNIYGGVSHRNLRELLSSLDKTDAPVFIVDLPGIGRSSKPKTTYTLEKIDQFINEFLTKVVARPAHVVAEGITTLNTLQVASDKPDLFKSLVIISPTGITSLESPPTEAENQAYQRLFQTDDAATWVNLLLPETIRFFDRAAFSQPSFLEKNSDILVEERLIERPNIEQRWLSYAFIFGQLFRPFEEASKDIKIPVLAIFGADYKPIPSFGNTNNPPIEPERAEQFRQIRPEFKYLEIPQASSLVAREQPEAVAKAIVEFSCSGDCRRKSLENYTRIK
ncbi:MAG: alpha/beta hydrolase [Cyanobacteria bacterium P01_A01_bin.80]